MLKSPIVAANIENTTFINKVIEMGLPLAIWRLPLSESISVLVSKKKQAQLTEINFEENQPGFAIAPFQSNDGQAYFLPADFFKSNNIKDISFTQEDFDKLRNFGEHNQNSIKRNHKVIIQNDNTNDGFKEIVEKAVLAIEKSTFDKVVLSRTKTVIANENFSPFDHFLALCEKYPNAFVSMTYLPWLDQVWLGASPEILVSQNEDGEFKTMALAGTQPSIDKDGNKIALKNALWSQKEIEEQAFVSRYIINCLKKLRIREYLEEGPRTIQAGNLLHLSSSFKIQTKEINFPQLGSVMLKLLHPTSAVCGMPKEAASEFIIKNEGYDREFYSGFLGPININSCSQLFVNLRSMKLQNGKLTLYAGCGITADSEAEKEWKETEFKMQTVLLS